LSNFAGTCPVVTFDLAGRHVRSTSTTEFAKGPCKDLKNGKEVKVTGAPQPDGSVVATRIELK
jgi:hypothetical protein